MASEKAIKKSWAEPVLKALEMRRTAGNCGDPTGEDPFTGAGAEVACS